MCGIIGYYGPRSKAVLEQLENLILEASRRGTHATGVAFLSEDYLFITNRPLSASEFLDHYDLSNICPKDKILRFIAHTRYSTSGPMDNQPLLDPECALVLNGVISQAQPKDWPMAELEPYKSTNDVEVALRYAKEGMRGEMPGSFAVLELWADGRMYAYRNGDRPLYLSVDASGGTFFASTKDILMRCGMRNIEMLTPGNVYNCCYPESAGTFATGADRQLFETQPSLKCPLA